MGTEDNPTWEWTAPNELALRSVSRVEVPPGHVEVRIRAIGICSTDLHIVRGTFRAGNPPYPLGHELSGTIETIGAGVPAQLLGRRVCVDPLVGCGGCAACRSGNKQQCPAAAEVGIHLPGGWQRYLNVLADNVYEIPDSVSFEEATQIENIHCCLGGIDKLSIPLGVAAAVFGDGPSGLYFVQLLRAAGAGRVVLVGKRDRRLAAGKLAGADETYKAEEAAAKLADDSFPIVIDAAGSPRSIDEAIRVVGKGGQLLMYGLPDGKVPIDVQTVIMKDLRLQGTTNAPHVWRRVIDLLRSGVVRAAPLISHSFAFEQLDRAVRFAMRDSEEAVKVVVTAP